MGEIRIKSGNLFDIEHYIDTAIIHNMEITPIKNGIRLTSTSSNDPYCNPSYLGVGITIPLDMRKSLLPCKPSTKYTIMLNQTVTVRKIVSYVDENFTNIQNFTSFDGEVANIQTPENCTYIILRIGNESTMPEGTTVEVTNIQLIEGTYTSETIPEYQPYFLNRPAHQYVNGEWIDIPTHHFINGRWQGELTSQSPLKFRADGDMLDWRIEGASGGVGDFDETAQKYRIPVRVEGENLFDINGNYSAYVYHGSPVCRVDNQQIIVNAVAPYYFTSINFSALIPSGQYTIKCKASANFRAMRLLLTKPFDTGTWLDSYQRYYADMIKNDNYLTFSEYTYTFNVDEDFSIGFAISGTTGDTGVIEKIMLNEGTAAFPYEGITTTLYTDHQLMNGDSIDYATDQTQIPLATGNNVLTVDTAVQPSKVFIKFEG